MNAPLSRTTLSDAMPLAMSLLKEGIATTKHHLPTILKLTLPYIGVSAVTALLFASGLQSSSLDLTEEGLKNPDVARAAARAVALPLFALVLVVLPMAAYTLFAKMRFVSQDPLPEPETQTMGSLWRFGPGFFGFLGLALVLSILAIVFMLPAVIVSIALGAVLFFLPQSVTLFVAGLPMDFASALWGAFCVISAIAFFKSPQDGMSPAISRGRSVITANLPLWIMLSAIGGVGVILQNGINGLLVKLSGGFPALGMALMPAVSLAIFIPLLFAYRAAAKR